MLSHIVPALPPTINGVGDYAVILAEALRKRGVVESCFITHGTGGDELGFPVQKLAQPTSGELLRALEASGTRIALLHFSGYGYARRGLCWWLAEGLRRWKRRGEGRRLVTVFHELYATGPIWHSSFWTALPQREIARTLARMSDAALTTTQASAEKLKAWRPELPIVVSPVFSNVGELDSPAPLHSREPTAVVFGQNERRQRAYTALSKTPPTVGDGLRRIGVRQILDIGPTMETPASVIGLPIERLGPLDSESVSARLAQARAGFVDYPLHMVTKSGIMAAYFAHGMLTVNTSTVGSLPDGIQEGRQFVQPYRLMASSFVPEPVAANGFAWYRTHNREATATMVLRFLT